jgi:hypothetical protein
VLSVRSDVRYCLRTPLVDDPARVEDVSSLGIDETVFLKANPEHPMMYVTDLVDLERRVLIDMIEGTRSIDASRWLSRREEVVLAGIVTVACTRATALGFILTSTTPARWPTRFMS